LRRDSSPIRSWVIQQSKQPPRPFKTVLGVYSERRRKRMLQQSSRQLGVDPGTFHSSTTSLDPIPKLTPTLHITHHNTITHRQIPIFWSITHKPIPNLPLTHNGVRKFHKIHTKFHKITIHPQKPTKILLEQVFDPIKPLRIRGCRSRRLLLHWENLILVYSTC